MSGVGLRLFVGVDVARPGWGGAWAATWSCRRRGGSGEGWGSCGATIDRGSAEVARHGLKRHRVSVIILVFQETSGRFYQKDF